MIMDIFEENNENQMPELRSRTIIESGDEKKYFMEHCRLASFITFPENNWQACTPLASAGFYLTSFGTIKCFSCGSIIENQISSTDFLDSKFHKLGCNMSTKRDKNNVPISDLLQQHCQQNFFLPENAQGSTISQTTLIELYPCQKPHHPTMAYVSSRLKSFTNCLWPLEEFGPTSYDLACAGFFKYHNTCQNRNDPTTVVCWYCNGGRSNWLSGEDPWKVHAKLFPCCEYLLQKKGFEYVNSIVRNCTDTELLELQTGPIQIPIINPQAELEDRLLFLLNSTVVKKIRAKGINFNNIKACLKRRIKQELPCDSEAELLEDLEREELRYVDEDRCFLEPPGFLQENLQEVSGEIKCKICWNQASNVLFQPCGHLCCCRDCTSRLTKCPFCRVKVEKGILVFN